MNYILFDDETRLSLLPFTFTRPVSEIRIGILTIREKWENYLSQSCSSFTEKFLQEKFPLKKEEENLLINASVLPDKKLASHLSRLKTGDRLMKGDVLIAANVSKDSLENIDAVSGLEAGSPVE